jgi:hypothetical protein
MDSQTLAAQHAQTGNLMDLCWSEAWLQESAQTEDAAKGTVEAGLAMKDYAQALASLTPEQSTIVRQQVKVQSLLFSGLRQWMESWELGAGFDETYTIARRLIRQHLSEPTPEQQNAIAEILAGQEFTQVQRVALLSEMFTAADWQAMAEVASQSISMRVLSVGDADTAVA